MLLAFSDTVTVSVSAIFPFSIASITSSSVITLVIEAGGSFSCAFISYSTLPVVCSIRTADLQASSIVPPAASSAAAPQSGMQRMAHARIHAVIFFIIYRTSTKDTPPRGPDVLGAGGNDPVPCRSIHTYAARRQSIHSGRFARGVLRAFSSTIKSPLCTRRKPSGQRGLLQSLFGKIT